MANQQELSDFIKSVHINLRVNSRKIGAKVAWEEHCKKGNVLKKYAETMKKLATLYWDKNITKEQNVNRICWIIQECDNFFFAVGQNKCLETENKLSNRYFGTEKSKVYERNFPSKINEIKLLDVGSCYNPLKQYKKFDVTAIDLAPATEDVLKCDFLEVKLADSLKIGKDSVVSHLPKEYFDVVVLSLLLEYLPHPSLRYDCCNKCYELLKSGGILLIITPDSKHSTANSQLIKNWRIALANIGFLKISYEKSSHLHCMSYFKCFDRRIPNNWYKLKAILNVNAEEMFVIPQDNVQYDKTVDITDHDDDNVRNDRWESDNKNLANNFSILAGDNLF